MAQARKERNSSQRYGRDGFNTHCLPITNSQEDIMTSRVASTPGSRFTILAVFLIASLSYVSAQGNLGKQPTDYVGTYADAPGHPVEIVAGDGLFAVVDEGKYPLRPSGVDQFSTISGQVVAFPRDAKGVVTGYTQDGSFHPRVSSTITIEAAALARPRPKGGGLCRGLSLPSTCRSA